MFRSAACVVGLVVVSASAEPLVAVLPEPVDRVEFQSLDPAFPPVDARQTWFGGGAEIVSYGIPYIEQADGSWCFDQPWSQSSSIELEVAAAGPTVDYTDLRPGDLIDASYGTWGDAAAHCYGSSTILDFWTTLLYHPGYDTACSDCNQTSSASFLGGPTEDGTLLLALRYRESDSDDPYNYGWIAIDFETGVIDDSPSCDPDPSCPPGEETYARYRYTGFAFETQPGVPIIAGGGLCEADFVPDATLDLSDIQAFISAFTSGLPEADLDGSGVIDLADISRFIVSFTTGCNLN